jgi:ribosomal protein S18 acetylase RimI-like enzyme
LTISDIEIRQLQPDDLSAVASVHQRAFPSSTLGRLGAEAIIRYYRWQLFGPHDAIGLVVVVDDRMVGFLVGGRFRGSMIGFVKRNAVFLGVRVMRHPGLLVHRRSVRSVVVGLRLLVRPFGHLSVEQPARVPEGSFGVLAVAVIPGAARRGIGTRLESEACEAARHGGFSRMHLTLDPANEVGLTFYRERGWHRLGLPGDTPSAWLMGKELASRAAS